MEPGPRAMPLMMTDEQVEALGGPAPPPLDVAILKKILKLQELASHVEKKGWNDYHKYKYVRAEDVMDKVSSGMVETGLICRCHYEIRESEVIAREAPKAPERRVLMGCTLELIDVETGVVFWHGPVLGGGQDSGDKWAQKAQTSSKKQAWMDLLHVGIEGADPEADTSVDRRNEGTAGTGAPPRRNMKRPEDYGIRRPKVEEDAPPTTDIEEARTQFLAEAAEKFHAAGDWPIFAIEAAGLIPIAKRLACIEEFKGLTETVAKEKLGEWQTNPLVSIPDDSPLWMIPFLMAVDRAAATGNRAVFVATYKRAEAAVRTLEQDALYALYATSVSKATGMAEKKGKAKK